jgi:hypothetical protein
MCTEAELACHFVSPSHVTFFPHFVYPIESRSLFFSDRALSNFRDRVNFLVYNECIVIYVQVGLSRQYPVIN